MLWPMTDRTYSESIVINRPPEDVYDMVSDVTRMGEWSPICRACWWDEGTDGPAKGAWFTGKNEANDQTWETHCQVTAAERGREFTFEVGEGWVRWSYRFAPQDGGTEVTESWEFLPAGLALFEQIFKDGAAEQIENRAQAARTGIPATLSAIKQAAEG